ncbi:MAG: hypothetical protein E7665_04760 [Ruminococcaceae bacterium]|nr:hypothetical protein [Oscillospiraceae bacterium]
MRTVLKDQQVKYPRVCAHRGLMAFMPENTLPSLAAAVAMGAYEIEFDLRCTKDGVIVCIHDYSIDRVSDGTGHVWDMTYEELLRYDFGGKMGSQYKGLKIPTFEQILQAFAGRVIMNIELKSMRPDEPYPEDIIKKIVALIEQYECTESVYFMSLDHRAFPVLQKVAPHIGRAPGTGYNPNLDLVQAALNFGAKKIQFGYDYAGSDEALKDLCERAHAHGLRCNIVLADEPELAKHYIALGVDTVFSNNYQYVAQGIFDIK